MAENKGCGGFGMQTGRIRLWDAARRDEYMREVEQATDRIVARQEGRDTAQTLATLWPTLSADEQAMIEFLLLSDSRSAVGNCDDPLVADLCEKGLLQPPPGVRAVLRQDLQTAFSVPVAVWDAFCKRKDAYLPASLEERQRRLAAYEKRYGQRLKTIPASPAAAVSGTVGPVTEATLMLCTRSADGHNASRVLSPSEYHALAAWLDTHNLSLGDLLRPEGKTLVRAYTGYASLAHRLTSLLARGDEIQRMIERWSKLGIWVIGERDRAYPARLRTRLKASSFPLLFGAGPREALNLGGLCIVGSRESSEDACDFARRLGARCGREGLTVISSDMRGVDREAMTAALAEGARVICMLSDSLEKMVATKRYREALATGRLVFVTPFAPDTRFKVANAMRSHKYQYGLSDMVVVVETRQQGGVWSGIDENRKEGWVPAFVRAGADVSPGNMALLHLGLIPVTREDIDGSPALIDLFVARARDGAAPAAAQKPPRQERAPDRSALYATFLGQAESSLASGALDEEQIARLLDLEPEQARRWLKRAADEGRIAVRGNPPVYSSKNN